MIIGNREFEISGNKTYVMGILNLTPDSFSDGGRWNDTDRALERVEQMILEGMDILDIGGESTRPGYTMLTEEEERERIVSVVEAVKRRFDIPISLDTYKSGVAAAGIAAGVNLINDIWGLKYDPEMAGLMASTGLPCCLMHNRHAADYQNYIQDVLCDLKETIQIALQAGIERTKIILDPGVGFGKTFENNLEILNRLEELKTLDCPILLGTSRKSVIGLALNLPVDQRLEGTLATTVLAVIKGCSFVRVHDIQENVRTIRMMDAILQR